MQGTREARCEEQAAAARQGLDDTDRAVRAAAVRTEESEWCRPQSQCRQRHTKADGVHRGANCRAFRLMLTGGKRSPAILQHLRESALPRRRRWRA